MEVKFTYKSSSKSYDVNFLPKMGEEIIMDGKTFNVFLVTHDLDNNEIEVVLNIE